MLIDFHTHCFPDRLAPKAMERLSAESGGLITHTDGTLGGLKRRMESDGVDISVVLGIATNAHQQNSVNAFAAECDRQDGIVAFGSVYPFAEDREEQLEKIKASGLRGVKLHPEYQSFFVNDPQLKPLYKKIGELGLITVFHAGLDHGFAPPYHATPEMMAEALGWFDSPVVAAHWGGLGCFREVLDILCGRDIYFDTSFGYGLMPRWYAEKIVEKHGADRLLFGTDTPWHTADMELRLLGSLGLSDDELDKITHKNAIRLLDL